MNENPNDVNSSVNSSETNGSWLKDKLGRPLVWMALGFVACKVLDAYTESKRTRRLTQ